MPAPLADVLVVDLTRAVAGPFCTQQLADLGARVIKVEEPGAGDETRVWGPPFDGTDSTYFLSLNRGKESIALDPRNPADLELLYNMLRKAQVVVENFRPGVGERLKLGYDDVRRLRPDVVYASISGFGEQSRRPGYDLIVQALSGLIHMGGGKTPFPVADILAALYATQGILAALRGEAGAHITVSLLESLLAAMPPLTASVLMAGIDPAPAGAALANIVPYQVFQCQDGRIAAGAPNERIWVRFCEALGHREWLADARFAGNAARNANRRALLDLIEPVFAAARCAEMLERLTLAEAPCAPVQTVAQALAMEEVTAVWQAGGRRTFGSPLHGMAMETHQAGPPALDEHGDALRREFGVKNGPRTEI